MSSILVYLEHQNGAPLNASLVAISAAKLMAKQRGVELVVALLGTELDAAAANASLLGASKVVALSDERLQHPVADIYSESLAMLATRENAVVVLGAATSHGKDILPRVAARLGAGMASEVTSINEDGSYVRPIYAGNAFSTVIINTPVHALSIRITAFEAATAESTSSPIEHFALPDGVQTNVRYLNFTEAKSDRPTLTDARVVVSGGRGLGSRENFERLLFPLADVLHAALGASRPLVDSGFVSGDIQVGQTGKVVAPSLYIAIGISGAIQHLAGIKDSKVIVAINKNADAPIFDIADYGLVADLFEVVPELTEKLKGL